MRSTYSDQIIRNKVGNILNDNEIKYARKRPEILTKQREQQVKDNRVLKISKRTKSLDYIDLSRKDYKKVIYLNQFLNLN